jgi:hypothetical protein
MTRTGQRTGHMGQDLVTALNAVTKGQSNGLQADKLASAKDAIQTFRAQRPHYDVLENDIANVLQQGLVPRTGNHIADLRAAYDLAFSRHPAIAAEKARRASRQVSGAPSPGVEYSSGRGLIWQKII